MTDIETKAELELTWTNCLIFALLVTLILGLNFITIKTTSEIKALETRIAVLEKAAEATVEIHVERAYDRDMAAYGYKMIAVLPEAEKETPK